MKDNDPLNYSYYKDTIDDRLYLLCHQVYNVSFFEKLTRDNLRKKRPLKVYIEETYPWVSDKPEANAFAVYESNCDVIFISRFLIRFFSIVLNDAEPNQTRYSWMFHFVLYYCAFHEWGHLYSGHCQLSKTKKLAMLNANGADGINSNDLQAMEYDADSIACGELAKHISWLYKRKGYKSTYNYTDFNMFLYDAMRALCGFMSIIKYHDYKDQEQRKKFDIEEPYDHPFSIFRGYYCGYLFAGGLYGCGISIDREKYNDILIHTDELFMHEEHDAELIEYQYKPILDGTIDGYLKRIQGYCKHILKPKLADVTRIIHEEYTKYQ